MRSLSLLCLCSCAVLAPPAPGSHQARVGAPASQRVTALTPAFTLTQFGRSIASGDFNGDGATEIAVGAVDASDHGVVTLWEVTGGAAALSSTLAAHEPPTLVGVHAWGDDGAALAAADINGDGFDDLIAGDPSFTYTTDTVAGYGLRARGRLLTYLGSPAGLTGPTEMIGEMAGEYLGESLLALGDVDADGFGDLFTNHDGINWNQDADVVTVLHGRSNGTLRRDSGAPLYVPGGPAFVQGGDQVGHSVAAPGDVDGDGDDDIVWSYSEYNTGYVRLRWTGGAENMVLDAQEGWELRERSTAASLRDLTGAGDINGDGIVDLVIGADNPAWTASWYAGTGAGFGISPAGSLRFEASDKPVVSYLGTRGRVVAAGDVDGDGADDLVALATNQTELLVYRWSTGAGGPTEVPTDVRGIPREDVGETLILLPVGDLDGDGLADLVHSDGDGKVSVLWGDGPANCAPGGFAQVWYPDDDGDGFASSSHARLACTAPAGAASAPGDDCDDDDATVSPLGIDRVGVDGDCDGQVLCFPDVDRDGWGAASTALYTAPACDTRWNAVTTQGGDCNDRNLYAYPTGVERLGIGEDNDCDGFATCYTDLDEDDWGDLPLVSVAVPPGTILNCGPHLAGFDNDCDDGDPGAQAANQQWYRDLDGDRFGDVNGVAVTACHKPVGYVGDHTDCADGNSATHPGAVERPGGSDDDCNLFALCYADGDNDEYGTTTQVSVFTHLSTDTCATLPGASDTSSDCDDASPTVRPGRDEDPSTPADDNCNRTTRPTLTISWGRSVTARLVDAPAGRPTALFGSRAGTGAGICPAPLRGTCLGILQAHLLGPARTTDGLGEAAFAIPSLPAALSGSVIWLQAATPAAAGSGVVTAPVSVVVP